MPSFLAIVPEQGRRSGRYVHHALQFFNLCLLHVNQGLLILPDSFRRLVHAFILANFLLLLQKALLVIISLLADLFELRFDAVRLFLVLGFLALKLV